MQPEKQCDLFLANDNMLNTDLASLGPDFEVPIYFFQGAEDEVTVTALAKEYFEKINAPHKERTQDTSRYGACPTSFCRS